MPSRPDFQDIQKRVEEAQITPQDGVTEFNSILPKIRDEISKDIREALAYRRKEEETARAKKQKEEEEKSQPKTDTRDELEILFE